MKHHTKTKGDIGVAKAIADLTEKGYSILTPMSEHLPFDLVTWKDGKFSTFQVKYRKLKKGILEVSFRSSWADKNGTHTSSVDKSKIDYYCIYCPDNDTCYYLKPENFKATASLRVTQSKIKVPKANFAENFLYP